MKSLLLFRKVVLAGILALLCSTLLRAQKFSESNHAYWYQPKAPVHSSLLVWQKSPDSLQSLASITLNNDRDIDSYRLLLHLRDDLDQPLTDSKILPLQVYKKEGNRYFAKADFLPQDSLQYLLLEVQDTLQAGTSFWSIASLHPEQVYPPASFFPAQLPDTIPLFTNYQKAGKPLILQGGAPSDSSTYALFFYQMPFEPAAPPLAASFTSNPSLEVTQRVIIPSDSVLKPSEEGLYFVQLDTTQLSGQSFRVTSPYFPEVGTLSEFAGPIRYLSTTDEWNQLLSNEFSKKEIDRFWLKVAQTEDRAKRIIKSYYNQVALANHYFTTYKEGWKTDQGMVYILYGAPDIVNVEEDRETWIYRKTAELPEIKFTFVRVKNPFTDRHFVLVRSKNYTKPHYQIVSQWRRGRRTL